MKYFISKEQLNDAWKRWTSGKASIPQLAKELGCPSAVLYQNFTKEFGKEVRRFGRIARTIYNPMKGKTIFQRYDEKKTWELFNRFKESKLSMRAFSTNKKLCPIAEGSARKLFLKYLSAEYEARLGLRLSLPIERKVN